MTWDQQLGGDHRSEPGIDPREAAIFDGGNGGTGGGGGNAGDVEDSEISFDIVSSLAGEAEDSVEVIYARHHEAIFRFFRTKVPSNASTDAEELTATVFLRLIERRSKGPLVDQHGQRIRSVKGLLYGMAFNVLKEHIRRANRWNKIHDIGKMSIADIGRTLSSQMAHRQNRANVHDGMREIPFYQHLVLDLCVYHEMSYQEISKLLGIPLGTVATLRRRAEINLQKWLAQRLGPATASSDDDPSRERTLRAAYPWYDPSTGAIDHGRLIACVMRAKEPFRGVLPEWYVKLEIPGQLPNATPQELCSLVRGVWEAWIEAGRPQ